MIAILLKRSLFFFLVVCSTVIPPLFPDESTPPQVSQEAKKNLTVELVLKGGRVLKLSDGTFWKIAPADIDITSIWVFSPIIEIQDNQDPKTKASYPNKLTNTTTTSSVLAAPL